jgi:hypothetical protein
MPAYVSDGTSAAIAEEGLMAGAAWSLVGGQRFG